MKNRIELTIEHKDHYTVELTNEKGDIFTYNPQKHEDLEDFLLGAKVLPITDKEIEYFLKSKGIEPNDVIYNMNKVNNPRIDIKLILGDFKKQLLLQDVVFNEVDYLYEPYQKGKEDMCKCKSDQDCKEHSEVKLVCVICGDTEEISEGYDLCYSCWKENSLEANY